MNERRERASGCSGKTETEAKVKGQGHVNRFAGRFGFPLSFFSEDANYAGGVEGDRQSPTIMGQVPGGVVNALDGICIHCHLVQTPLASLVRHGAEICIPSPFSVPFPW